MSAAIYVEREHGPIPAYELVERGLDAEALVASGDWEWWPPSMHLRRTRVGLKKWWDREKAEEEAAVRRMSGGQP